jgi:two-component system NtrC family sensor kinase
MKWLFLVLVSLYHIGLIAQQPSTLTSSMLSASHQLYTGELPDWEYTKENTALDGSASSTTWQKLRPVDLTPALTDDNGRLNGWMRLQFRIEDTLSKEINGLRMGTWCAADVYLDGKLINSFGHTGADGNRFKEFNPFQQWPTPISLSPDTLHTLLVRIADQVSPFDHSKLQMQRSNQRAFLTLTTPAYERTFLNKQSQHHISTTVWISTGLLLSFLFWLMYFLHKEESYLRLFAILTSFSALSSLGTTLSTSSAMSYLEHCLLDAAWSFFGWMMIGMTAMVLSGIFKSHIPRWVNLYFIGIALFGLADGFFPGTISKIIAATISLLIFGYILFTSWRKIKGAQWAIVAGLLSTLVWLIVWAITRRESIASAILLSFPLSLLVYVALRFRTIQHEIREAAERVVALAEEKKKILTTQNELLEQQVEERTASLHKSIDELKSAQSLLVQSEKMASLGQLTAGIAHEIQNPLNFVTNFSEVNKELLTEMRTEITKGNIAEAEALVKDILENEEKINHHGKRADAIVKGMLQHSRTSSGTKEPTDINALCDEYLRLAYHGLRAKDKTFNATTKTDFDNTIGMINLIPQDIGRVILNLITNAFSCCVNLYP